MTRVDQIMIRYRQALNKAYGDRLGRVILYGSRARGDARTDSDYDVAVFIKDYSDLEKECELLSELELEIIEDTGKVINSMPFHIDEYYQQTAYMNNVRLDGVDV